MATRPQILERRLCPPLEGWREDEPNLWPFCTRCDADIRKGQRYSIVPNTNLVICEPCTAQSLGIAAA